MSKILVAGQDKANKLIERRQRAEKLRDSVLKHHGKDRWIATRQLWFILFGQQAYEEHLDAIEEAKFIRATALDPKYGRTAAALGIAYGQRSNKNTTMRLKACMPEGLETLLMEFDPFNLKLSKGERRKRLWDEVYETFPEYKTAEKL